MSSFHSIVAFVHHGTSTVVVVPYKYNYLPNYTCNFRNYSTSEIYNARERKGISNQVEE